MDDLYLSQLSELMGMLTDAGIPFQFSENSEFNGYQLLYSAHEDYDHWDMSAICHDISYGHEEGLIEIMGLLTDEEFKDDSVLGNLTAEEVFKRVKTDWIRHQNGGMDEHVFCPRHWGSLMYLGANETDEQEG